MKKLNVIYGCLVFVLLVAMCSCGSRKVNKEHSKEETTSNTIIESTVSGNTDTNVKTTTAVKIDDKNEIVTEETVTEPIDVSKEAFIIEKDGTKVVLNNTKKVYKKTTQKNNIQTQLSENTEQVKKETIKEQKDVKQENTSKQENSVKNTDKKQFNPFVSIVIGLIGIVALWCIYRFYKKLPLVPKF